MRINHKLTVALTGLAAITASGFAQAIEQLSEIVDNQPISKAHVLTYEPKSVAALGVTVSGQLDNYGWVPGGDQDYYRFYGRQSDVLTIEANGTAVPLTLALFTVHENADGQEVFTQVDQSIGFTMQTALGTETSNVVELDYTGDYIVAVTNAPRSFAENGGIENDAAAEQFSEYTSGPYALTIKAAQKKYRDLVVNPMGDGPGKLNPNANYTIPVAILSDGVVKANLIDKKSLTFGSTGTENSLHKCDPVPKDVNGDNLVDLICHFSNRQAGWDGTETNGFLKGQATVDGKAVAFEAKGDVNMVGAR